MSVASPNISLIIPALNEEAYLPGLLESVSDARAAYRGGSGSVEAVVVDNESTDRTAAIALAHGCQVINAARKSIAHARNAGAQVARGTLLAFVDADSRIHPETFNAIEEALSSKAIVGATGIKMSRTSVGIAITMLVVRVVTFVMRAGPGVLFCRRSDWETVGGFDETRLYAEDVKFQFDLKRLGRARSQGFVWARGVPTITSARKYDRFGDWHAFGLVWHWIRGPAAFDRFVKRFWYDPNR